MVCVYLTKISYFRYLWLNNNLMKSYFHRLFLNRLGRMESNVRHAIITI